MFLPSVSERYCVSEIYPQGKWIDRRVYAFCQIQICILLDFVLAQMEKYTAMETNWVLLTLPHLLSDFLRETFLMFSKWVCSVSSCFHWIALWEGLRSGNRVEKESSVGWSPRLTSKQDAREWMEMRLNRTTGVDWPVPKKPGRSDVLKLHIQSRVNVSLWTWLKWACGRPEGNPGDAKALHSGTFVVASFLLPFCFVAVPLNFVRDRANQMSHDINTHKCISEQPVRSHWKKFGGTWGPPDSPLTIL